MQAFLLGRKNPGWNMQSCFTYRATKVDTISSRKAYTLYRNTKVPRAVSAEAKRNYDKQLSKPTLWSFFFFFF
jgi:hypothetical protein